MTSAQDWIAGARPRTLPAAVAPVLVGTAAAHLSGGTVWWKALLALVVSLALQVGVNYANDYSDGIRGTDADRVGPMRLVGSGRAAPRAVKLAAFAAFGVAGLAGLVLTATTTWWLLPFGVAAVAAAWFYTGGPRPYGYAGLGELFVFVFFGLTAVLGTEYVQSGTLSAPGWCGAVAIGLLACALLVVNNLRDIPGDTESGKRTLAVRLGERGTRVLFAGTVLGAYVAAVPAMVLHPWSALVLLSLPAAVGPLRTVLGGARGPGLIPALGGVGRLEVLWAVLFGLGLVLSA